MLPLVNIKRFFSSSLSVTRKERDKERAKIKKEKKEDH
jgi:hypothetical protein